MKDDYLIEFTPIELLIILSAIRKERNELADICKENEKFKLDLKDTDNIIRKIENAVEVEK